jgi:tRNA threonylcarbamoyladenosine biosynthesis protein TsaB
VKYPEAFESAIEPVYPNAADLAELAVRQLSAGTELLEPLPLYLRRPDAVEPGARKPVSQPALR